MTTLTEIAARPAPAFALFLISAVLFPLSLDLATAVIVFDFALPTFMAATTIPIAGAITIPMLGVLAPVAAMTAFILPWIGHRRSE
jgi:hypothetical protein